MTPTVIKIVSDTTNTYDLCSEAFEFERTIYLDREIDNKTATEIILQLRYLSRKSDDDITMIINSPGGSVAAGLAIIDAMKRCRCDIRTVCTGLAASMASVILACGTPAKRCVTPYSEVMIHQPLGGTSGQASDIERAANHIMHTKDVLMKILSETTGQSIKRLTADCDRDSYFTAEEALKYGLADNIFDEEDEI